MLPNISYKSTEAFKELIQHFDQIKNKQIKDLFNKDKTRFDQFNIELNSMVFDYSKNLIDSNTISLLAKVAEQSGLKEAMDALFSGQTINDTENRAVMHTALRSQKEDFIVDDENISSKVKAELDKVKLFSDNVRSGQWKGYTGLAFTDIVNIGIGGSDLGPKMVCEALKPYAKKGLNTHFISNVDSAHIYETLMDLNPETTLFIVASKTFTTQETMINADSAKKWFNSGGDKSEHFDKHFLALTTNFEGARAFGVSKDKILTFWDWVGGRYSLWSTIGFSIACSVGFDNYRALLNGAEEIDTHFEKTPFEKNVPVLMGLLGVWYNHFFDAKSHAIFPYDQYLHRFPAYLQQVDMESNGKSYDRNGQRVDYNTGQIVWGEPGTNGQHAFYQLVHQGTHFIPCDFIASINAHNDVNGQHEILLSHFFAQTEALMNGKTKDEVVANLRADNVDEKTIEKIANYKIFEGNRPTNTILMDKLTPFNLGQLIALYEHKIFVQGVLWNIYSFDQFGVELGKILAKGVLGDLQSKEPTSNHDSSTNALINRVKERKV